jgi:hypothetical protein
MDQEQWPGILCGQLLWTSPVAALPLHRRCYVAPSVKPRTVNTTPPDVIMKPQPNTAHGPQPPPQPFHLPEFLPAS